MSNIFYGGFDTKLDINGMLHPWRLLVTDGQGRVYQRQIKLPTGISYLSLPRDPIWGDLTRQGAGFEDQIESLAEELPADAVLHLHRRHSNALIERVFRWHGVSVKFHDIEIVNADPLRISGEAGCEIGSIMTHLSLKRILEVL